LPTGSPHVFVAKAACQELNINPRSLFATLDLYDRHDTKTRTSYSFEPYGPLYTSVKSSTGSADNMRFKPEVAFLGRSNVGKSSLINALMNKTLAVTSKNPGRTQQAFYYGWIPSHVKNTFTKKLSNQNSMHHPTSSHVTSIPASSVFGFLVDLPGYGYAVGPDDAVETWQASTQEFLLHRRDAGTLRRVFVLQDARLESPQRIDGDVILWLENANIPHTVILTKADDHHSVNRSGSTAGVIKHANLCSLRYHLLWKEAGARLPDHAYAANSAHTDNQNNDDMENRDDSLEGKEMNDSNDIDPTEEPQEVDAIMLSPIVHVTSSKKQTGLAEILSSIETEFASKPIDE
jgi:GTP-binding protein